MRAPLALLAPTRPSVQPHRRPARPATRARTTRCPRARWCARHARRVPTARSSAPRCRRSAKRVEQACTAATEVLGRRLRAQLAPRVPTARSPPAPPGALCVLQAPTRLSRPTRRVPVVRRAHTAIRLQRVRPRCAPRVWQADLAAGLALTRRSCVLHAHRARTAPSAPPCVQAALRARTPRPLARRPAQNVLSACTAVWPQRLRRPCAPPVLWASSVRSQGPQPVIVSHVPRAATQPSPQVHRRARPVPWGDFL